MLIKNQEIKLINKTKNQKKAKTCFEKLIKSTNGDLKSFKTLQ